MPGDEGDPEANEPTQPDQPNTGGSQKPPRHTRRRSSKRTRKRSKRPELELEKWNDPDTDLPKSVIPQLAPHGLVDVPETPRPGEREYPSETEAEPAVEPELEIAGPFSHLDRAIDWFRRAPVMGTIKLTVGTLVIAIPIVLISLDDDSEGEPGTIETIEEDETPEEDQTPDVTDDSGSAEDPDPEADAPETPDADASSDIHLSDPTGDAVCEASDGAIDPALDITAADFVQQGDAIAVTASFNGSAEAYNAATSDSFPLSVQLRLLAGGPFPEAFFGDKDNMKVSGGLLSVLSHEFSGNELIMLLTGRTLEDVMAVRVSTFVFGASPCEDDVKSPRYDE